MISSETINMVAWRNGKQELILVEMLDDPKMGAVVKIGNVHIHSSDINLLALKINKLVEGVDADREILREFTGLK